MASLNFGQNCENYRTRVFSIFLPRRHQVVIKIYCMSSQYIFRQLFEISKFHIEGQKSFESILKLFRIVLRAYPAKQINLDAVF